MASVNADPKKIFIHLFGKTGSGKSATGNTILGRKCFNSLASTSAVTKKIQREPGQLGDIAMEVVDGPSVMDDDTGVNPQAIDAFYEVVKNNEHHAHVLVVVCRYGDPFTQNDQALLDAIRKNFGSQVFQNHGLIVMTCGDNFAADTEDENITFRSWCQAQTGTFAGLLQQCQGRAVLFENFKRSRERDMDAVHNLQVLLNTFDLVSARGGNFNICNSKSRVVKKWLTRSFFVLPFVIVLCLWKYYGPKIF